MFPKQKMVEYSNNPKQLLSYLQLQTRKHEELRLQKGRPDRRSSKILLFYYSVIQNVDKCSNMEAATMFIYQEENRDAGILLHS